jgi:hypothetical protein
MRFHTNSFRWISDPIPSGHPETLDRTEERLGLRLPLSVREWYGDVDGRHILSKYSNRDHALLPSDFGRVEVGGKSLVIVLIENQSVCRWGFELDGTDDPPVYVDFRPHAKDLFRYSQTFSEFTYVRVFDFEALGDSDRMFWITRQPLTNDELRSLEGSYTVESRSWGWPSDITYRFSSTLGRITIWQSERQADWSLSATSPEALIQLQQSINLA